MLNRPHGITAEVDIPAEGAEGVQEREAARRRAPREQTHNWVGRELLYVVSDAEVSSGSHALRFELEPTGQPDLANGHGVPARLQVYLDGERAGGREVPYTTPFAFNPGVLTCGADPGSPVTTDYEGPFRFTETIHTVTVDLGGNLLTDAEAELRLHMARRSGPMRATRAGSQSRRGDSNPRPLHYEGVQGRKRGGA